MHQAGAATSENLEELLRRVADSDHEAFEQIYQLTSRRVQGLVTRVVKNPALSAEVVQEVFLMMWVSASSYRPELGTPETWIFTLAHRRAVDRVRSEQRSGNRDATYTQKQWTPQEPVEDHIHHTLMTENVRRCLASLTDLQAEAIKLAYYGGLTYVEVAEALQVKLPTAKSRIQAGLVRLRDAMQADGYGAHSR